ncbi:hypothetical protein WOLCODRAFT_131531 [Wolfiporia cocos MD-104 SS10]|uniref:RRM domain-containing protein n=1 Tax=Wolfiporia cocos (strain MD-104) TaxID=742152 RepID=A0A2H3JSP0_WOLCO|nr:hypothetical protein WOLCODRAFT_131531 [Wolfiporia cocos MD-104 SS10]
MAPASSLPASVSGFTPIPVLYSESSTHILYARAHSGSKKSKRNAQDKDVFPDGRTLFLVNIPPDATEREITLFFKSSGTVEKITLDGDGDTLEDIAVDDDSEDEDEEVDGENIPDDDEVEERPRKKRRTRKGKDVAPQVVSLPSTSLRTLRRTGRSAHVVFLDESSLSRALSASAKARPWPTDSSVPTGLAHYRAQYDSLRPPLDAVKAHADTYMDLFEYEQAKKKQQSKYRMGEAIVDDDGFTLVVRGGAYGKTLGGGVGVASKRFQAEQAGRGSGRGGRKNKKEKKEKDSFYSFQIHEKKRQELLDLKRKWEEDKAKVEKLKQSKKFKPY